MNLFLKSNYYLKKMYNGIAAKTAGTIIENPNPAFLMIAVYRGWRIPNV